MFFIFNIFVRRFSFFVLLITVTYLCSSFCFGEENVGNKVQLENEYCMPRKEIVPIDAPLYQFKPAMVSVYRCRGMVGDLNPAFKTCVKNTSEILQLEVTNFFTNTPRPSYSLENHTSCTGKCVRDESACTDTQVWDSDNCKCICDRTGPNYGKCPEHFSWDLDVCGCVCSRTCLKRQIKNATACSCTCKPKFYRRCNKKEKLLVESNCSCIEPKVGFATHPCDTIPTKWAVMIIVLSFLVLFVLAFDCVLYGKKTGCLHNIIHLCERHQSHGKEENMPMNKNVPNKGYTEANA